MGSIIFHKFFEFKVKHEYFEDLICRDLSVVPSIDTEILMQNYGMLFKHAEAGAILAQEVIKDNGNYYQKIPIENEIKLRFYLTLTNFQFLNYTDMEFGNHTQSIYYFNNQNPSISDLKHTIVNSKLNEPIPIYNRGFKVAKKNNALYILLEDLDGIATMLYFKNEQSEIFINTNEFSNGWYKLKQYDQDHLILSASEIYIDKDIFGSTPFGIFEVTVDQNYDLSNPIEFIFNFKSRSVKWRYKIFEKDEASISGGSSFTPTIEHDESGPSKINFTSPTGSNPVIIDSTSEIKFRETGIENINLKKNNDILMSNLPNASFNSLKKEGSNWLSDIYVYYYV